MQEPGLIADEALDAHALPGDKAGGERRLRAGAHADVADFHHPSARTHQLYGFGEGGGDPRYLEDHIGPVASGEGLDPRHALLDGRMLLQVDDFLGPKALGQLEACRYALNDDDLCPLFLGDCSRVQAQAASPLDHQALACGQPDLVEAE